MRKIMENKRLFITLIAGLLLLTVAIGAGTWAWFTGSAEAKVDGSFQMAKVDVGADDMTLRVLDFYPGAHLNVMIQKELEKAYDWYKSYGYSDDMFLNFWAQMPEKLGGTNGYKNIVDIYQKDGVPTDYSLNDRAVVLIENAFGKEKNTNNVVNVTPSSIVEASYNFSINKDLTDPPHWVGSYIPVYFRIPTFELKMDSGTGDLAYIQQAYASITGPSGFDICAPLLQEGDYCYCAIPLSPEAGYNVTIKIFAYICGAENDNDLQYAKFSFVNNVKDNVVVEVIQATNNAVFMVDGWSDVAGLGERLVYDSGTGLWSRAKGDFFIPYVNADLYKAYLDSWK